MGKEYYDRENFNKIKGALSGGVHMLTIEEYIARRKKEDKLNEFDHDVRTQIMKVCVDYVFAYFNNYLNLTESDERTVLQNEKLEKYRKQLREYEPEVREWVVGIYNEYGKQMNRYIGSIMKENELFFCMIVTVNLEMHHMIVTQSLLRSFHSSRIRQKCCFVLLKTITGLKVNSGLATRFRQYQKK